MAVAQFGDFGVWRHENTIAYFSTIRLLEYITIQELMKK